MANPAKRVAENMPGDFFVDTTCIDCDACRQIAPETFGEASTTSFVRSQPASSEERRRALHALLSCPTGSIGCLGDDDPKAAFDDFPLPVDGPVSYCGFNSPKSYGGNSWFVRRPGGNWLIDAPKFARPLVDRIAALGGVSHIFLTHRDDVADAAAWAARFGARRIIHANELDAQPDAETILEGDGPWELAAGTQAIFTPGHTEGHCVALFDETYLFTGDHLAWDRDEQRLTAFRDYCWHSWPLQVESLAKLADVRFSWVLPGHGQRVRRPHDEMRAALRRLVESYAPSMPA